ncbi:hypothetical protein ACFZDK_06570 [Streptomyces sp. NPDC007901]|uniref:hypothetical protein n=1 Tax=Streptomyces sp. NPDC007901 TaxID=3364785 RepID=UPI0036EBCE67
MTLVGTSLLSAGATVSASPQDTAPWNSAVLAFARVAERLPGRLVAAGPAAAALLQAAAAPHAVMSLVRDAAGGLPLYLTAECAAPAGAGYVLAVTGREAMRRL